MPARDVRVGALEHGDRQASAGDLLLADAVGGRQVDPGLGLVGQPDHGGPGAGLHHRAQRVRSGGEVRERPRLVAGRLRYGVHAHANAGDDAQRALRADQQLPQIRSGRRLRGPAQVEDTGRGDGPQSADHVVEPAVTRGVLTGRAGGGEAPDRREQETLREVAQREAAFAEQAFGLGPGQAGTQFRLPGHLVEGMQCVESAQVQRDDGLEVTARRVQAADHTGAAAERDDRDAVVGAEPEHRGDLVLTARNQHRVGRVLDAEVPAPQQVQCGFAACPQQPGVVVDGDVLRADDRGQPVAVGRRQGRRT